MRLNDAAATRIGMTPCPGRWHYQIRCIGANACGSAASEAAVYMICDANCNCSSTAPVLNVLDCLCFIDAFAAGCS